MADARHYVIKKESFIFDNEECLLIMLSDVTTLQLLQEERHKVHMMKLLHATVSHDIMSPINIIKNFVEEMLQ